MNFLKNFFNDEGAIVGLCGFDMMKPKYCQKITVSDDFFNPFDAKSSFNPKFETNFSKNAFLLQ